MEIDISALEAPIRYKLLTGIVVPRPIAWVSTIDREGVVNLAPFSFFNAVNHTPPTISVSIMHDPERAHSKDTLHNIQTTGEFVVNIADETLVQAMNETATNYPADVDEFAVAGLTALPAIKVRAPRVKEAPVSMECRVYALVPIGPVNGGSTLVIGEVVFLHARDGLVDERARVAPQKLRPIGRLAGSDYTYVHETFAIDRKQYDPVTGEVRPIKR